MIPTGRVEVLAFIQPFDTASNQWNSASKELLEDSLLECHQIIPLHCSPDLFPARDQIQMRKRKAFLKLS